MNIDEKIAEYKADRKQRLKEYIDEQLNIIKSQLYSLIGESQKRDDESCDAILERIYTERDGKK